MPPSLCRRILEDLRNISAQHAAREAQLQHEQEAVIRERESTKAVIQDNQRLLSNALAERDRACRERDDMASSSNRTIAHKQSFERLQQVERNLRKLNTELQEKVKVQAEALRIQEEKLSGEKALWSESQSSSAHHEPYSNAPYSTPSSQPRAQLDNRSAIKDGSIQNLNETFQALSTAGLPSGRAKAYNHLTVQQAPASTGGRLTGQGSGESNESAIASMSLVPYVSEDDMASVFTDDIVELWETVRSMCCSYFSQANSPQQINDIQNNNVVWKFLLRLSYPETQDAITHTRMLLGDQGHRQFLIVRIAAQYIVNTIWSILDFCDYNASCARKITDVVKHLKTRGLSTSDRAEAMAVATSLIQQIVNSENYLSYRAYKLAEHTKALRTLLGPVLDKGAARASAGREIAAIVVSAFELAQKMHTSSWAFSSHFPECGTKFIESGMDCRNRGKETAMNLQLRQARVKLSMTPVITMRDDRGVAIRVKQLAPAYVLCMN